MSSQRILQLANAIHHEIAEQKDKSKRFAFEPVILIAEFLQLKPLSNIFDDGEFMFRFSLFQVTIMHRFELKKFMRQNLATKHLLLL